jgi:hypothetical protein
VAGAVIAVATKLIELGWLDPEKLSDRDRWLAR